MNQGEKILVEEEQRGDSEESHLGKQTNASHMIATRHHLFSYFYYSALHHLRSIMAYHINQYNTLCLDRHHHKSQSPSTRWPLAVLGFGFVRQRSTALYTPAW